MSLSDPCPRELALGDPQALLLQARRQRPIGLVAGGGRYPLVFAQKAQSLGLRVIGLGINDAATPELAQYCEHFYWTGVARMGRMVRLLKRHGVERLVMAGKVQKA